MSSRLNRIAVTLFTGLVCAACGSSRTTAAGDTGRVRFSARANANAATSANAPPPVCGTFVLQPVSIDAAGHETPAGSPVTLNSTGAAQTDAILGCIDDGNTTSPNWGYQVTASGWTNCVTGAPLTTATPAQVFTNQTVTCTKGQDVALAITVAVSIPAANSAGYIDISVGVNETTVQTGCKNADLATDGNTLHFGESYIDPGTAIHQGLVGVDSSPTPAQINQWAGTVGVNSPAAPIDTYYTGQLDLAATGTSLVYQTFLSQCAKGAEYQAMNQAQCVTTIAGGAPSTAAQLADAFIAGQSGFVAASVVSPTNIQLYSSQTNAVIEDATPPGTTGFNPGTSSSIVTAPIGSTFTSVKVDQSTPNQLLVTGLDGTLGPVFATLSFGKGWTLSAWAAISTLTTAQISCTGIFANPKAGCFTPTSCSPTPKPSLACIAPLGAAQRWVDENGQPALIPLQARDGVTRWLCSFRRATATVLKAVVTQPCDGADGSTPYFKLPMADPALVSSNYYYRDGHYLLTVQQVQGGLNRAYSQALYMSSTLDKQCACPHAVPLESLLAAADNGQFASSGLSTDTSLTFGVNTITDAPLIHLEFNPKTEGAGYLLNYLVNPAAGAQYADHGYGKQQCGSVVDQISLRHRFTQSRSGRFVGMERDYMERMSGDYVGAVKKELARVPLTTFVRSCRSNRDTGKQIIPALQWATYDASLVPRVEPLRGHPQSGQITPLDIDCTYELMDANGTWLCVNLTVDNKFAVTRIAQNIQCRLGPSRHADGTPFTSGVGKVSSPTSNPRRHDMYSPKIHGMPKSAVAPATFPAPRLASDIIYVPD